MNFNKVVIWGHFPPGKHTSSYPFEGYQKAFQHLGYETFWLPNQPIDSSGWDNCLFLTEGQEDSHIPLNKSSTYVLHNVQEDRYVDLPHKLNLQIFHRTIEAPREPFNKHRTFNSSEPLSKINDYTYYNSDTLYQPWATDLLPHEIDTTNINLSPRPECFWAGTYGGGNSEYENGSVLTPFFEACWQRGLRVVTIDPWAAPISSLDNRCRVGEAYVAPALQGPWQVDYGYGPHCRILKNISYGAYGITNNPWVQELFEGRLVFDRDPVMCLQKLVEKRNSPSYVPDLQECMAIVREKHTFINRIQAILSLL